jgi:hypothetical protein
LGLVLERVPESLQKYVFRYYRRLSDEPLQNDDIQLIFLFLHRTGNKKETRKKAPKVRIKVLPHECKPDVYQRIEPVFQLLPPHRRRISMHDSTNIAICGE